MDHIDAPASHDRRAARTVTRRGAISLPAGLALTAGAGAVGRQLLLGATSPGADPASVLAGCAAVAASLIAGWLTLCLLLCLLAQGPGTATSWGARVRDRLAPALVRRWAAIVLGTSALGTCITVSPPPSAAVTMVSEDDRGELPGPSTAAAPSPTTPCDWAPSTATSAATPSSLPAPGWSPADPGGAPVGSAPTRTVPAPGWVPHRPPARAQGDPHLLTSGRRSADPESDAAVVVRRGDSLWSIASARLGPGATDEEVARAWPGWYDANSAEIGTDPHTLRPGMRLTPPTDHS